MNWRTEYAPSKNNQQDEQEQITGHGFGVGRCDWPGTPESEDGPD
jgi:hypothetical protein